MSSDTLPARPNLDQLRRRAKELRDAARTGDPAALTPADQFLAACRTGDRAAATASATPTQAWPRRSPPSTTGS